MDGMTEEESGRSPSGRAGGPSDLSPASGSQPKALIPNAVTISGELYAFLMGEGPMEGVWFDDLNSGRLGRYWWRALLSCAAGWPNGKADAPKDPERLPIHYIPMVEEVPEQ